MNARDNLFRRLAGAFITEDKANALLDAHRAEVLSEAIEAARGEYLRGPVTDEGDAYDRGVSDAIAAIGALTEGGAR